MSKLCVFAGTTEGRELVEFLSGKAVKVTACVATEYGETLLQPADNLTINSRGLPEEEMVAMMERERFDLVIDATHPYAAVVTECIVRACGQTGTEYLRLLRGDSHMPEDAVCVPDIPSAVEFLNMAEGNILMVTGSRELSKYIGIRNFPERVYARILPMQSSLDICASVGLKPAHIIAMQGPFSKDMNMAMLRSVDAKYMVTKDGGDVGGFEAKVAAVREAGARLVVIGRPPQKDGLSFADTVRLLCERFSLSWQPVVSVVGIGPGSRETMTAEVVRSLCEADCLIGARRMLEAVARPGQHAVDAVAPRAIADYILGHPEHHRFAVVMSGDVGFFSGTKKLLPLLDGCRVSVQPGLSSMVCLCARLGVSYEDVVPVSLHGRDHNIVPDVRAHRRVFALVGGENGINRLCSDLIEGGLGQAKLSVCQRLSYPDEHLFIGTAEELASGVYDTLSVALIENTGDSAVITHGLPDETFRRGSGEDGVVPMTKSEVRAVCLSKLQLREDSVCWDVGAGTGSVSIEMAMQARKGQVYAIERKDAAVELLRDNKKRLYAENLTVVPGLAPEACRELPAPSHAFIGGSAGNMREILTLLRERNPRVRVVATAIALESVAELMACMKEFDWKETEVVSMQVSRGRKAGPYHLMTGQNPVYIFTLQAGGTEI